MAHRMALIAIAFFALAFAAGCGVKGPLEAPTGSVTAGEIVDDDNTNTVNERKPTILDGLLE
ncbi:MAG: LPS translocon maturation chaperone LptM [Hyphomicrobiaceae bacterium]